MLFKVYNLKLLFMVSCLTEHAASIVMIRGTLDGGIVKSSMFFTSRIITDAEDGPLMEQRRQAAL